MVNWKLCILYPVKNTRKNVRCSFNILAEKITRFYENGIPVPVSVSIKDLKGRQQHRI